MKRLIYIIVTVTIIITLIGCGTGDDISSEIYNAIVDGEYQTAEELLKNNDIDLETAGLYMRQQATPESLQQLLHSSRRTQKCADSL